MILSLKLLFLLGFTLHNLEESAWLPEWSKHAKKYHEPVERNQFIFAVIIITMIGYLLTLFDIMVGQIGNIPNYIYLGFIGMMGLNSIFPHLVSTIIIKKYAPGLITGILLNLPLSLIIIIHYIENGINIYYLILSIFVVSSLILFSLKYLFKIGAKLIKY
ncbi:MAG: HXXEE domain-containing protein [Melioribacteraceae bacterium]|nr:HXXEE domain-containing protein [Melioribacteraceae bacterium]